MKEFLKKIVLDVDTPREIREEALEKLLTMSQVDPSARNLAPYNCRVSGREYQELLSLIRGGVGNKIPAIKLLRQITNYGLKEAKNTVETYENWGVQI